MLRIAYLGPPGTYAEEAVLKQRDLASEDLASLRSVPDVIAAVEQGDADVGLVPIENSIEGSVAVTLDTLAFDTNLLVQREIDLPVSLHLCANHGTRISDITSVVSHPNPHGQCRSWLARKLPGVELVASNSTAEVARQVAESGRRDRASIGTARGAEIYGLEVLASEIEDHPENQTRFVLVGHGVPGVTGHDKTSIVCFQREDRPGSLLAILQEFAARAINLTKLESRPTKRSLGDYCFFIDFTGHIDDELVADCLKNLRAKQADVKFLGSYPVAGEEEAHARRDAAARAWRDASEWVDDLRRRVVDPRAGR